ncbi:sigma-70 family RNA polymerase sigma factor [Mycobacterium riyadhense]|uniref:RNA polymerase subunit sigma n=1 Tax=Mycobacterium riyadhense TaxID=486698 RepID=A0A1X2CJG7_9MYCO|nr:sigma-70 family RNA polymerase sigma factor [Mycobacterium riyadhense]MCV7145763.1 sigma-70 family RNA polymerase sigma factor [Mycobacterium riyadhense]ORW76155.1 RNA polymerase subunit sigma [Mycobacterium riyadhense]VTO95095.1 ECF RNA polymerase sigma factor SigJ [Mycobacterium riyadhense]
MTSTQVAEFEELRPHLMSVAYRLTGTVADAEDIVQEAWLRWDRADTVIEDLRAWLTTVVSRLGLDRLRSAAHRRETYTGTWLPEPVVTGFDSADPLSAVVAAEDARFAAMVVLERLSPDQRVAFVLHDGFAMPFAEVAEVLGTNEAAARQLASRARKALKEGGAKPPPNSDPSHNEVVGKLMAAMAAGDLDAVVSLLHPDVTFTGDSNGKAPTAVQVIHGADKVARFMFGLARRYGPSFFTVNQLALVNGELGAYTEGCPGADGFREMAPRITAMTVRDGKVCALWDIANPDKFTGSPLRAMARGTRHRS